MLLTAVASLASETSPLHSESTYAIELMDTKKFNISDMGNLIQTDSKSL